LHALINERGGSYSRSKPDLELDSAKFLLSLLEYSLLLA
jgi:hypothetical protein